MNILLSLHMLLASLEKSRLNGYLWLFYRWISFTIQSIKIWGWRKWKNTLVNPKLNWTELWKNHFLDWKTLMLNLETFEEKPTFAHNDAAFLLGFYLSCQKKLMLIPCTYDSGSIIILPLLIVGLKLRICFPSTKSLWFHVRPGVLWRDWFLSTVDLFCF